MSRQISGTIRHISTKYSPKIRIHGGILALPCDLIGAFGAFSVFAWRVP